MEDGQDLHPFLAKPVNDPAIPAEDFADLGRSDLRNDATARGPAAPFARPASSPHGCLNGLRRGLGLGRWTLT